MAGTRISDGTPFSITGVENLPIGTGSGKTIVTINSLRTFIFSTAIPNGTIATTQTSSDNSTKLATTAFCQSLTLGPFDITNNGYVLTSGGAGKLLLGDKINAIIMKLK